MFLIIAAFIAAFWKGVMFGSGRRYAWPVVNQCIDNLPGPWTMDHGTSPRTVVDGP